MGTRDRQDAQIWDAIDVKNYKQALKLVDKRLAKKPTTYHEVSGQRDTAIFLSASTSPFLPLITARDDNVDSAR